ncbi:MAG: TlpA family protein disulfide reductase [Clostridia bacterium]
MEEKKKLSEKKKTIIMIVAFIIIIFVVAILYNFLAGEYNKKNENNQNTNSIAENMDEQEKVKATEFVVFKEDGSKVKLSDVRGKKPIIINFWATWCEYCKKEMPDFEEAYVNEKDNIEFMMINFTDNQQETLETAKTYIEENGFSFPVYYDMILDAVYKYEAFSLPLTIFIDKDGYIYRVNKGLITKDKLNSYIEELKNI